MKKLLLFALSLVAVAGLEATRLCDLCEQFSNDKSPANAQKLVNAYKTYSMNADVIKAEKKLCPDLDKLVREAQGIIRR